MFFRDCDDPSHSAPAAYIWRYSGARPELNRDENGAQKLTEPATAAAVLPSQRTQGTISKDKCSIRTIKGRHEMFGRGKWLARSFGG